MSFSFSSLILLAALFSSQAFAEDPFHAGALEVPLSDPPVDAIPLSGSGRTHGALVGDAGDKFIPFQSGDLIVAYNGAHVESSRALKRMVAETMAGREVEIRIFRDGVPRLINVKLARAPTPDPVSTPEPEPLNSKPRELGAKVIPLDPDIARYIGFTPGEGLQVIGVLDQTPAKRAGVQSDDLLLEVEGKAIRSPEHLLLILNRSTLPEVDLTIYRDGEHQNIRLRFDSDSTDK